MSAAPRSVPRHLTLVAGGHRGGAVAYSKQAAITASAVRLTRKDADMTLRLQQPWQARAFAYYEQLGEIWYASQFYARALAKLELKVSKIDPAAPIEGVEDVEDATLQDYVTRIQDPGGGRANFLGSFGRLLFLVGEGYALATRPPEDRPDDPEEWEFLSADELRPMGDGTFQRMRSPNLNAEQLVEADDEAWEPLPGECVVYRIWRRHPRWSGLADSPMRGVLDLCEELLMLTLAVRARAVSRVAGAGVLLVPEEISPKPLAPVGDEDPEEDEFLDRLTTAMIQPIKDQGDASAVVPLVVRGASEYLKEFRHLPLSDPTQLYPETGLRTECIRRIAIGLDMPPEALEGTTDANHWTAWSIDEQTWKAHLQPVAQTLVDDLTAAYLRPAMEADGIANPSQYAITYDASEIINHPDRTSDAKDAWDRLAISDEEYREILGFDEQAAPNEAEWLRRAGFLMHDSSMAAYGIPGVRGVIEPAPGELEKVGSAGGEVGAPVTTPAASSGTGPPPQPTVADQQAQPPATSMAASGAEVAGAMRVGVERCRELAGARVRSRCQNIPAAQVLIDGEANALVASALGRDRVASICPGLTPRELVRGGGLPLVAALHGAGLERGAAVALAQACERHAAQTLYMRKPPPVTVGA